LQREALAVQRRLLPADHPDVATSLNNLGRVLRREQRFAETEPIYREVLALTRRWPSAGNRFLADALFRLGKVLHQQGKLTETADVWREALAIRTKLLGAENPEVSVVRNSLAGVLCEQGGPLQAETLYRELLRDLRNRLPSDDPRLASALVPLTRRLLSEEKFAEAEPPARECLAIWEKKNPDAWETFNLRSLLGESLLGQKRYGEAEPLLLSGCEGMKQREANISSPNRAYLRQSLQGIVRLYESIGRTGAASEWRKELSAWHREQIEQYRKPAELGDVESLKWLAWLLATCESSEVRDGQAAMRHAEKLVAVTRRQNFACLGTLAAAYAEAGEFAKAVAAQGEALALGPEGKIKENYASRLRLYEAKLPYRDRSRESDL
jgi:tetratricopeptide (TPR) repeat protein